MKIDEVTRRDLIKGLGAAGVPALLEPTQPIGAKKPK